MQTINKIIVVKIKESSLDDNNLKTIKEELNCNDDTLLIFSFSNNINSGLYEVLEDKKDFTLIEEKLIEIIISQNEHIEVMEGFSIIHQNIITEINTELHELKRKNK